MSSEHLTLPPGTALLISESHIDFLLRWTGQAGQHVVHLRQTIEGQDDEERQTVITTAVMMFRNVIGMEVIEDALAAGEWPDLENAEMEGNAPDAANASVDRWGRTQDS